MELFQSAKALIYVLRHSNIVLSFVLSSHMIILTNKNTVLLWRAIYFALLNRSIMADFCSSKTIIRQADFLTPQILLDKQCCKVGAFFLGGGNIYVFKSICFIYIDLISINAVILAINILNIILRFSYMYLCMGNISW